MALHPAGAEGARRHGRSRLVSQPQPTEPVDIRIAYWVEGSPVDYPKTITFGQLAALLVVLDDLAADPSLVPSADDPS